MIYGHIETMKVKLVQCPEYQELLDEINTSDYCCDECLFRGYSEDFLKNYHKCTNRIDILRKELTIINQQISQLQEMMYQYQDKNSYHKSARRILFGEIINNIDRQCFDRKCIATDEKNKIEFIFMIEKEKDPEMRIIFLEIGTTVVSLLLPSCWDIVLDYLKEYYLSEHTVILPDQYFATDTLQDQEYMNHIIILRRVYMNYFSKIFGNQSSKHLIK
jgi:hypothetical protein